MHLSESSLVMKESEIKEEEKRREEQFHVGRMAGLCGIFQKTVGSRRHGSECIAGKARKVKKRAMPLGYEVGLLVPFVKTMVFAHTKVNALLLKRTCEEKSNAV